MWEASMLWSAKWKKQQPAKPNHEYLDYTENVVTFSSIGNLVKSQMDLNWLGPPELEHRERGFREMIWIQAARIGSEIQIQSHTWHVTIWKFLHFLHTKCLGKAPWCLNRITLIKASTAGQSVTQWQRLETELRLQGHSYRQTQRLVSGKNCGGRGALHFKLSWHQLNHHHFKNWSF